MSERVTSWLGGRCGDCAYYLANRIDCLMAIGDPAPKIRGGLIGKCNDFETSAYLKAKSEEAESVVNDSEREAGWYWVRILGFEDEYSAWTPALWKLERRAWHSVEFSGVPDTQMIVGEKLVQPSIFDQAEFDEMVEKGAKAWADVPDPTAWLEELRGNDGC
ncbi:MAG: hypothetical protein M0Q44_01260 [Methylobacter sp.]|jgi:hypothetical protein|nr:hypothetical protein [Methylobacter sp.]